jgi:hypothetical protein
MKTCEPQGTSSTGADKKSQHLCSRHFPGVIRCRPWAHSLALCKRKLAITNSARCSSPMSGARRQDCRSRKSVVTNQKGPMLPRTRYLANFLAKVDSGPRIPFVHQRQQWQEQALVGTGAIRHGHTAGARSRAPGNLDWLPD